MLPRFTVPSSFDRFDEQFERVWRPLRSVRSLDVVFYTASEVGDFGMVWLAIASATAALGPQPWTRWALRLAVALIAESLLVNGFVKSLFLRERPEWNQDRPMHLRKPRTSSFPSGHSSSAMTAFVLLSDRAPLWAVMALAVLVFVVATSRVHVRIHHGSDVVAGLLVGAAYGTAVRLLFPL